MQALGTACRRSIRSINLPQAYERPNDARRQPRQAPHSRGDLSFRAGAAVELFRRRGRDPRHRPRSRRQSGSADLDHQRVHAEFRQPADGIRRSCRPVRPQAPVHARHGALHRRFARALLRADRRSARLAARRARHRGRGIARERLRSPCTGIRRSCAHACIQSARHDLRRGSCVWSAGGRRSDRRLRLALDLSDDDRARRAGTRVRRATDARDAQSRCERPRLARHVHLQPARSRSSRSA